MAFLDRLSTILIVEKVAPQTVLLNSGEERGLVADSRSETKGRSPLLQDRFCSGTTRWVGLHRWVGWGGAGQLVIYREGGASFRVHAACTVRARLERSFAEVVAFRKAGLTV